MSTPQSSGPPAVSSAPAPAQGLGVPTVTVKVPDSCRILPTDPRSITFRDITVDEELDAQRAAGASPVISAIVPELVKRSVVAVDGQPTTWAGAGPTWYDKASTKVRDLCAEAFGRFFRPTQQETKDFLDSASWSSG